MTLSCIVAPQNELDGTVDFFVIILTRTPRDVGRVRSMILSCIAAPQNGLDGTADFFVITFNKDTWGYGYAP